MIPDPDLLDLITLPLPSLQYEGEQALPLLDGFQFTDGQVHLAVVLEIRDAQLATTVRRHRRYPQVQLFRRW
jgi:hypothetical protein